MAWSTPDCAILMISAAGVLERTIDGNAFVSAPGAGVATTTSASAATGGGVGGAGSAATSVVSAALVIATIVAPFITAGTVSAFAVPTSAPLSAPCRVQPNATMERAIASATLLASQVFILLYSCSIYQTSCFLSGLIDLVQSLFITARDGGSGSATTSCDGSYQLLYTPYSGNHANSARICAIYEEHRSTSETIPYAVAFLRLQTLLPAHKTTRPHANDSSDQSRHESLHPNPALPAHLSDRIRR